VLFVRRAGWRDGGFAGLSSLSSLIGLSDNKDSYFLKSGQGQMRKVKKCDCAQGRAINLGNTLYCNDFIRPSRICRAMACYAIFTMPQWFGVFF